MKKQFVIYDIALRLKELGFDEPCLACYTGKYFGMHDSKYLTSQEKAAYIFKRDTILAPLWQQAIDWLFQKNVIVTTEPVSWEFENIDLIKCSIWNKGEYIRVLSNDGSCYFKSPYKAREQAILKALTLIK